MNPTGTLKKGAKPTAIFNLPNGAEVVRQADALEYAVISQWGNEGRCYRSYSTKAEALARLAIVSELIQNNLSKFVDGYTLYVMEAQPDNTYNSIKKYVKGGK